MALGFAPLSGQTVSEANVSPFVPIGVELQSLYSATPGTTPSGNGARRISNQQTFGNREYSPAAPKTTISGILTVLGVATGGMLVRAYRRDNGDMLGQTTTAGDGSYTIECGGATDVYVIAYDPASYQAIVFDQLTPG